MFHNFQISNAGLVFDQKIFIILLYSLLIVFSLSLSLSHYRLLSLQCSLFFQTSFLLFSFPRTFFFSLHLADVFLKIFSYSLLVIFFSPLMNISLSFCWRFFLSFSWTFWSLSLHWGHFWSLSGTLSLTGVLSLLRLFSQYISGSSRYFLSRASPPPL